MAHQDFDFSDTYDSFLEGTLLLNGYPVTLSRLRAAITFEDGEAHYYQTETRGDGTYSLGPLPVGTFDFDPRWMKLEDGSMLRPTPEPVTTLPGEITQHDFNFTSE